jgi:DNA-binding response OmpR family regulator
MEDKVLVVDDEQQVRELLGNFLEKEGYEVVLASNGEEAIELTRKESPQVILLDLKLPGIDGIETCRRLKMEDSTRFIPIIMITAYSDNKMEAIDAGADDFINKPFDLVELSVRVKSILRVRYLTDELERVVAYVEELQKNLP